MAALSLLPWPEHLRNSVLEVDVYTLACAFVLQGRTEDELLASVPEAEIRFRTEWACHRLIRAPLFPWPTLPVPDSWTGDWVRYLEPVADLKTAGREPWEALPKLFAVHLPAPSENLVGIATAFRTPAGVFFQFGLRLGEDPWMLVPVQFTLSIEDNGRPRLLGDAMPVAGRREIPDRIFDLANLLAANMAAVVGLLAVAEAPVPSPGASSPSRPYQK